MSPYRSCLYLNGTNNKQGCRRKREDWIRARFFEIDSLVFAFQHVQCWVFFLMTSLLALYFVKEYTDGG